MFHTTLRGSSAAPVRLARRLLNSGPETVYTGVGALTITQHETQTEFAFDVPGFDADSLKIDVRDGHLIVHGDRSAKTESENALYSERRSAEFHRTLRLGRDLDPSSADAIVKDGVLTVSFTPRPESRPHRIEVRHASPEA